MFTVLAAAEGAAVATWNYLGYLMGPRLSAAMVALYGFTQMVGPWLTKQWLDGGGTLVSAFGIGVAALVVGLVFVFFVPRSE